MASGEGSNKLGTLVLAGGCFWCVEAVFREIEGVTDVISGYAGGSEAQANYEAVCTGKTGHAEAVKIVYDSEKVSLDLLFEIHFALHDPTTLNRQGADSGPQYRSAIFFADSDQERAARKFISHLTEAGAFADPIVTTLEPLGVFYPAEPLHQDYVCRNPHNPYIQSVAMPKLEKVRSKFSEALKEQANK